MVESLPKTYKPGIILSVVILVGSLFLLAIAVVAAFATFGDQPTPLWVTVVGATALLGIAVGFGGFVLLMLIAGFLSFREHRRVQILPPQARG
jgi:membrane protein implicated in regulation of membrane protease activity